MCLILRKLIFCTQGGSKHDGMASILRIRHGASYLSEKISYYNNMGSHDLIDVHARRSMPSRTSSEVAAISFGMKCALHNIPLAWREQVLILSDSEFAIDFFVGNGASGSVSNIRNNNNNIESQSGRVGNNRIKGRRKGTSSGGGGSRSSTELRNEAHRRTLLSLIKETPRGVLFSKVRSSSRGVQINNVNIHNNIIDDGVIDINTSWKGIGFIDHDAADHLSSVIRSSANSNMTASTSFFGASNVADPLGWDDLLWLENSETCQLPIVSGNDNTSSNEFWQAIEVVGSEARCERKRRNRRRIERIEKMIGLLRRNKLD